jgi:glycosyltransferase involved in cell wall biosynthesis
MPRLLAIPNDATSAFSRSSSEDFLSEINPKSTSEKRFFDSVNFLNWKDDLDCEYFGVKSHAIIEDKKEIKILMEKLTLGEIPFTSPLFLPFFEKEREKILRVSKIFNPDVIRAFNTHFAAELGYFVSQELDIPLVISAHDPSRLTSAINYADSLVCISDHLADLAMANYGINLNKITIIPDGVDTQRLFYPRDSFEDVVPKNALDCPRILSVGRVVPNKNIETLLVALSNIKPRFPNFSHIHLGNGQPKALEEVINFATKLGLEGNVHFLGGIQKDKLPFYYSWADIYALPTLWEGLGRAQIEALSCGTPVITTNDAPMNTIVHEGYNGFLVDPHDSQMITDKINSLLLNNSLRSRMAKNARKSIARFDVHKVMQEHCKNYSKLINRSYDK